MVALSTVNAIPVALHLCAESECFTTRMQQHLVQLSLHQRGKKYCTEQRQIHGCTYSILGIPKRYVETHVPH